MKIFIIFQGKKNEMDLPKDARVIDAIKKFGVNPETILVKRGDEILLEDEKLKNNDEIEFIKIVSGG